MNQQNDKKSQRTQTGSTSKPENASKNVSGKSPDKSNTSQTKHQDQKSTGMHDKHNRSSSRNS